MNETGTTQINTRTKAPFYLLLICLLGFFGMISVCVGQFSQIHPLLKPAGWAVFLGANLLMILNGIFRKKRSDVMGEFHAYNMISWFVTALFGAGILLMIGLALFVWSMLSNKPFDISNVYLVSEYLAIVFALRISYGWITWFVKNRKIKSTAAV